MERRYQAVNASYKDMAKTTRSVSKELTFEETSASTANFICKDYILCEEISKYDVRYVVLCIFKAYF